MAIETIQIGENQVSFDDTPRFSDANKAIEEFVESLAGLQQNFVELPDDTPLRVRAIAKVFLVAQQISMGEIDQALLDLISKDNKGNLHPLLEDAESIAKLRDLPDFRVLVHFSLSVGRPDEILTTKDREFQAEIVKVLEYIRNTVKTPEA